VFSLALLLLIADVGSKLATISCDLAEVNHYHDQAGRHHFTQLIAWDWSPDFTRFDAQSWLMVESYERDIRSVVVISTSGERIELFSKNYRETWTKHDPERENAKVFPINFRRKVW
jgi:hypothetical protein